MTKARFSWELIAPAIFLFVLPITHTTPLRLTCLGLSLVSIAATLKRRRPAALPSTSLRVALVAWIAVCLAACLYSIEPEYSWGEFRNEVLVTTIAFVTFYWLTDGPAAWRVWRAALAASFVTVALLALYSYRRDGEWLRSSFVGDRNAFSTYIVLIVPFLLLLWMEAGDRRRRIAVGLALLLALVAGAATQNRNMWIAIALECVAAALLAWFRLAPAARRALRRRYLVASLIGTVVFAGSLVYVTYGKAIDSKTTFEERARIDRDPRFEIWVYAAERIRERPWFGYGYGRGILRSDFRTHFDNILKWHGHNMLIDYVLEAGVLGGLVIVGLFAALARQAWRVYRVADDAASRFGAWSLTLLIGVAIKVMTDDILVRESSLLFWSALGMSFGFAARASRQTLDFSDDTRSDPRTPRPRDALAA